MAALENFRQYCTNFSGVLVELLTKPAFLQ